MHHVAGLVLLDHRRSVDVLVTTGDRLVDGRVEDAAHPVDPSNAEISERRGDLTEDHLDPGLEVVDAAAGFQRPFEVVGDPDELAEHVEPLVAASFGSLALGSLAVVVEVGQRPQPLLPQLGRFLRVRAALLRLVARRSLALERLEGRLHRSLQIDLTVGVDLQLVVDPEVFGRRLVRTASFVHHPSPTPASPRERGSDGPRGSSPAGRRARTACATARRSRECRRPPRPRRRSSLPG